MLDTSGISHLLDETALSERQHLDDVRLDRRGLSSILTALRLVDARRSAFARAAQLVRLSVDLAGCDQAILVSYDDEDGSVAELGCSTDDPAELAQMRHAVTEQESRRPPTTREDGADCRPAATAAASALLRIPVAFTATRDGALYLLGVPAEAAQDEVLHEFVRLAALLVGDEAVDEERHQWLAWGPALADVIQVLLSTAGDDEIRVWQRIADHVCRLAHARTVTVSTPSEDDPDLLQVRVVSGAGHAMLVGLHFPRAGALVELAMTSRRSQSGPAADLLAASHTHIEPRVKLGPLLAIPLTGQGSPRGALLLSREAHRESYSSRDITMVEEFAAQATLALEVAETRAAQTRLQARTDIDQISITAQDLLIQRLFALSLTLDLAARTNTEPWLHQVRADLAATIAEARRSLRDNYHR